VHQGPRETGALLLDQEAADRARAFVAVVDELRPHDGHVRDRAVGDPALGAVQDEAATRAAGARDHAPGVRAVVGLGQTEAADRLAARQAGQPGALLVFGPEGEDRVHHQRGLHACERAQTGVAALELLGHEPVADGVEPGAAVLRRDGRAEAAERREARHQLHRERAVREVLAHERQVLVVDEASYGVADGALLG